MLKFCGDTICRPLAIIFKQQFESGIFASIWKKDYIAPIHKKGNKQSLKNLPICGKVLERIMLNEKFFIS